MVRRWNHLKGDSLRGRSVVYIHLPVSPAAASTEVATTKRPKPKRSKAVASTNRQTDAIVHHKVKQGETLYSIASNYKTTVDALKRDNRNIATLRPGMVLVIRP
jgi:LysM repeat protein